MVMMGPSFKFRKLQKFPQSADPDITSCSYGGDHAGSARHNNNIHHHHHHHHITLPFGSRSRAAPHCSSNSDQHHHMSKKVPKGYVAVYAGVHDDHEEEEEEERGNINHDEDVEDTEGIDHELRYNIEGRKRYLVPVSYLSHPAFEELLERAREEFGFRQQAGGLSLPCSPREFEAKLRNMQSELTDQLHPHSPCVPSLDHLVHTKPHWSIKLH